MIRSLLACSLSASLLLAACSSSSTDAVVVDAGSGPTIDAGSTLDAAPSASDAAASLVLSSPAFAEGGAMAAEYTCDGVGHSPALAWTGAPQGTVEYALLMTTEARDGRKWNWVLHSIPSSVSSLAVGSTGVGVAGLTSDGPNLAYAAPCSQGPGAKSYTFTLYALSQKPTLPSQANQVTGAVLAAAMADRTLASSALTVTYTR